MMNEQEQEMVDIINLQSKLFVLEWRAFCCNTCINKKCGNKYIIFYDNNEAIDFKIIKYLIEIHKFKYNEFLDDVSICKKYKFSNYSLYLNSKNFIIFDKQGYYKFDSYNKIMDLYKKLNK